MSNDSLKTSLHDIPLRIAHASAAPFEINSRLQWICNIQYWVFNSLRDVVWYGLVEELHGSQENRRVE